ncbi:MAG TPA: hypothetical protein VIF61_00420 [Methylocystis sp.]|jgi:hypothetical protein
MWTDGNGFFYEGDRRPGDRAATDAEVAAWQAANAPVLSCTALQFRLALNQIGLRKQVEDYVAGADQDTKDWWAYSQTIHADNPLLLNAAASPAINKTRADIDAVIALGKTLA